jgi:tRNA-uridine 2-sulfurtransferase
MTANQKPRVVVGLSGGVDSSAAAARLRQQGYEVIGITLKLWQPADPASGDNRCCGVQAVYDSRDVCHKIDVPYYVLDESEAFQREVIAYFAAEYRAGRTPNPCVLCNQKLKFGALIKRADQLDAPFVATGHYARVEKHASGRYLLKRGCDPLKDQSYFLFSLQQSQLSRILLPLGEWTKSDSRQLARQTGLPNADKEESMEICFVTDDDYAGFLVREAGVNPHAGDIIDRQGKVLGQHRGIEFFTIGQRKGLRLSNPEPWYVVDLDPATNQVVVGASRDLERTELTVECCNWIAFDTPPESLQVRAKIRYKHAGAAAQVTPRIDGTAQVRFHQPQRAITPGQACVFYDGDTVVGGGWIVRESPGSPPPKPGGTRATTEALPS